MLEVWINRTVIVHAKDQFLLNITYTLEYLNVEPREVPNNCGDSKLVTANLYLSLKSGFLHFRPSWHFSCLHLTPGLFTPVCFHILHTTATSIDQNTHLLATISKKLYSILIPLSVVICFPRFFVVVYLPDQLVYFASQAPVHPKNENLGERKIAVGPLVYVEHADAVCFKEGENVTLINWGNCRIEKIHRSGPNVTAVDAQLNLQDTVGHINHLFFIIVCVVLGHLCVLLSSASCFAFLHFYA